MEPRELGRLVEEHAAGLALYARQWCAAPEDVVQDAFLKLVVQRPPPRHPVAWLYSVVRNQARSAVRSMLRRRWHESRAAEEIPAWFIPSEDKLDAQAATQALQKLPADEREVILLHVWGGLTFAEVAGVMDCSDSTAHRWYLAGLERLRERLNHPCPNLKIET